MIVKEITDDDIKAVMKYMHQGKAPSEIDKLLKKPAGYSHDIVCRCWRLDRA